MNHRLTVSAIFVVVTLCPGRADTQYAPQGTLRDFRFSPDGRHVLAQNGSEITILTVEPFAVLFRIPAVRTEVARFTPDSRQVVFVSGGTRLGPQQISLSKTAAHGGVGSFAAIDLRIGGVIARRHDSGVQYAGWHTAVD